MTNKGFNVRKIAIALVFNCFAALAYAQGESADVVRLANMLLEGSWPALEAGFPIILSGMEAKLQPHVSERAAKTLSAKMSERLNRENLSKFYAVLLSTQMKNDELNELSAFLNFPTGQKYLKMSGDVTTNTKLMMPLMKEACELAALELSGTDKEKISAVCRGFAAVAQTGAGEVCKP